MPQQPPSALVLLLTCSPLAAQFFAPDQLIDRRQTRVTWVGLSSHQGIGIDYGQAQWRPEHKRLMQDQATTYARPGKDEWTTLQSTVDLQFGGWKVLQAPSRTTRDHADDAPPDPRPRQPAISPLPNAPPAPCRSAVATLDMVAPLATSPTTADPSVPWSIVRTPPPAPARCHLTTATPAAATSPLPPPAAPGQTR